VVWDTEVGKKMETDFLDRNKLDGKKEREKQIPP
jgi:hypothetical protein